MCREEAAGIIAAQYSKKESGALAAYEEQLNEVTNNYDHYYSGILQCDGVSKKYKLELKERRDKVLGASSSHTSRSKSRKKSKVCSEWYVVGLKCKDLRI